MHLHLGQAFEDVADLLQLDPVELDVLPGGEVAVVAVVVAGDVRQGAHLGARQGAVGDGHAQHVGVLLQVQAVLQTQRQELLLAQLAVQAAFDLVAKLRDPLEHQGVVVFVVLVHAGYLVRPARTFKQVRAIRTATMPAALDQKQRQIGHKKPYQMPALCSGNPA
ncbi:hypothetical protein D9M71_559610 [compost metagenome]